jgi:hypothetical protein
MRDFSRGWARGDFDDETAERIKREHWAHVEELTPRLPDAMRRLYEIDLHDAVIVHIEWRPDARELTLVLGAVGTDASHYRTVTLRYADAFLWDAHRESLRNAARDREAELHSTRSTSSTSARATG